MSRILFSLMLLSILLCGGCRTYVPTSSKWPVIQVPSRPAIEIPENPDLRAMTKAAYRYSRHIDVLEATLDTYNAEARAHNEKVEEELFGE